MKELEAHAAPLQSLVQRRKHDFAHARAHFPEERAAIGEKEA